MGGGEISLGVGGGRWGDIIRGGRWGDIIRGGRWGVGRYHYGWGVGGGETSLGEVKVGDAPFRWTTPTIYHFHHI